MASVTVEEVARAVAAIVDIDNDLLLVGQWVSQRWQEIANSTTLRSLRRIGEVIVPAPYSTGTIDVTRGSTAVTGTSTAFTNDLVGRHLRVRNAWYEIAQVLSATSLTLKSAYSEETSADASYNIIQRRIPLENDVRKLGTFVHMRVRRALQETSQMGLDLMLSSRYEINSIPKYVSEVEPDENNVRRVEIYPYPQNDEIIHYVYWKRPPVLMYNDFIPGDIDTEALREGVLVDMYRNLASKSMMKGDIQAAGFWRNESRAQDTVWRNVHKPRLMQQDDGLDDLEFMLMRNPAHPRRMEDRVIGTAYDQVWFT